jgi:diguanylate cyclase (GGDEF)-like protein/PAS domain S-box-containing protein
MERVVLRLYACIAYSHDLPLVILAGNLCVFACYTAIALVERGRAANAKSRRFWIAVSGLATGLGIWATHFVAILAYRPNLPVGYDLPMTLLSVVAAVVVSGIGISMALRGDLGSTVIGGLITGLAAPTMHYLGMAALRIPAAIQEDNGFELTSVAVSALSFALAFVIIRKSFTLRRQIMACATMVLGILGLHFIGMASITLVPLSGGLPEGGLTMPPSVLAVMVAIGTVFILILALIGSGVDRHLMRRSQQETTRLRKSEKRFRQLADSTFEGIVILREGHIVDCNAAFRTLLGRSDAELIGTTLGSFGTPDSASKLDVLHLWPRFELHELEMIGADQVPITVEILARSIDIDGDTGMVMAIRDVTERKLAQEEIRYLAHHDPLTRLANRATLRERLDKALEWARQGPPNEASIALLRVNIDRFRIVNDVHGSSVGDKVLRTVADRLDDLPTEYDIVARIGSDEFAVLVTGMEDARKVVTLADQVLALVNQPIELGFETLRLTCSIGIAIAPMDGRTTEILMQNAESALQRARAEGRGIYRFFEPVTDDRLRQRRLLELDLRHALEVEGEIQVHYQPLFHADRGEIYGFEALCRWQHPARGAIPPSDFIPIAEESGLMLVLGEKVLRMACARAASWPGSYRIAVNLSPTQFRHPNLVETVLAILAEVGLPAERLELEVTEGVLIDEAERALAIMGALKRHNIRIALDDFGTGYSSFSYLLRFPFDVIKIDRSFISALGTDAEALTIVSAIVALGHNLNKAVTAEGVETDQQRRLLRDIACDHLQGYYFARPSAEPLLTPPETAMGPKVRA